MDIREIDGLRKLAHQLKLAETVLELQDQLDSREADLTRQLQTSRQEARTARLERDSLAMANSALQRRIRPLSEENERLNKSYGDEIAKCQRLERLVLKGTDQPHIEVDTFLGDKDVAAAVDRGSALRIRGKIYAWMGADTPEAEVCALQSKVIKLEDKLRLANTRLSEIRATAGEVR